MGNCVVEVYTSTSIIRGVISHDPGHRLLDILNHTGLETTGNKGNFLTVSDATICTQDNKERNIESILVNTANIFFIKEITDDTEKPFEKESANKIYPYVSKERITIKFYMPSYSLTGKLHYSKRQDPMDVLNAATGFFALTDASITCSTCSDGSDADFLAVNRKQVLYIEPI
jgi:hypothetical protein